MELSKFKRLGAVALGVVLTSLAIPPADAGVNISSCACATTADFVTAARQQASLQSSAGTYMVVSIAIGRTAYVSVTGRVVGYPKDPVFVVTTATPIDANSNSLVGLSETQQEATYSAIDTNIMMAQRSSPLALVGSSALQLPPYVNIDMTKLQTLVFYIQVLNVINAANGATLTLTWTDGSGIVATYTINWVGNGRTINDFSLTWKSAKKNGQPIDKLGHPVDPPKNGGDSIGSTTVPGFGSGADWLWFVIAYPQLDGSATVYPPVDIGEGQPMIDYQPF